jgi:outer membrane protein
MKTTRSVLVLSALLVLGITSVRADFVGFKIGASYWEPELTGSFIGDDPADTPIDLVLTLEHPIPLLPNIRYQNIDLDSSGSSSSSSFTFEGQPYLGPVTSTFDLSHDDIVLYYEILDNWINLDIGLDVKIFDGEVALSGFDPLVAPISTTVPIDETIPLLYLSARFDLPFSGFYIGADFIGASTSDNSMEDASIMLGFESDSGLGFEGGIKKFSLEINDVTDINADLEYDGIYLNGYYNF